MLDKCAQLAKKYKNLFLGLGILAVFAVFVTASTRVTLPRPENPIVLYSNQCGDDLKYIFAKAARATRTSLYVQIYSLTEPSILKQFRSLAAQNIPVRIFYDPGATPSSPLFKHVAAYPVHTTGLMHRKILVIDHSQVFIGTANFTKSSLDLHDNLVTGIYSHELANFIENGGENPFKAAIGDQHIEMWMLPELEKDATKRIADYINQANKQITIAMFTLTHPILVNALITAYQRGVAITIVLDSYTAEGASLKAITELQEAGIAVRLHRGKQLLHHKWAWIDNQHLILGSTNWTRAAFTKNQDCFIILSQLTQRQNTWLSQLQRALLRESSLE